MIQNQGTNPTHKTQRGYMIQNQGTNFDGFLELLVHWNIPEKVKVEPLVISVGLFLAVCNIEPDHYLICW